MDIMEIQDLVFKAILGTGIFAGKAGLDQAVRNTVDLIFKNALNKSGDELKKLIENSIMQVLDEEFKEELAGLKDEDIRNIVDVELKKVEYKMSYENRLTIRYEAQYAAEVTAMLKLIDTSDLDEGERIDAISIKVNRKLTEEEQEKFCDIERLENVDSPFNFEVDGFSLTNADAIFTTCLEHDIDMNHVAEYAVYMDRHLRDISRTLKIESVRV